MPDIYSAKQVATRIGTDAKTLRKFLRSSSSPYDAVGQGKRYEFPQADLATIKKAFDKWHSSSKARAKPVTSTPKPKLETIDFPPAPSGPPHAVVMGDKGRCLKCKGKLDDPAHIRPSFDDPNDDDWTEFDPDREPTEGELADIDDLLEDLD